MNPLQSVTTNTAQLGNVYLWQLNGDGIRDLDYDEANQQILILSSPPGAGGSFKLWTWNGKATSAPTQIEKLADDELISRILAEGVAPGESRSTRTSFGLYSMRGDGKFRN